MNFGGTDGKHYTVHKDRLFCSRKRMALIAAFSIEEYCPVSRTSTCRLFICWHNVLRLTKKNIMSACNFSIPFSGSPADVLQKAEAAIHDQGGHFKGDDNSGIFQLSVFGSDIAGTYNISGQELIVSIDSKPFMIPCSTIQGYLSRYLDTVRA